MEIKQKMIMEYTVSTDKNELDLIEGGYYEFYPGTFNKTFWNDNSIYISDALMDILRNKLEKSNDEFHNFDYFTYFNAEQINKFEYELSNMINEINNNKKIFDEKRDYLNKEINEHEKEIIEALKKLIYMVNLKKENGISVIKKWYNFKILKINDLPEVDGAYLELLPGKYENKCWNDNSIYIEESELCIVNDLLHKVNNEYMKWGFEYYYDENMLEKLENELQKRLDEIINNGYLKKGKSNKKYYDYINVHMDLFKNDIIEMLDDLISWIKMNKSKGITVIGM